MICDREKILLLIWMIKKLNWNVFFILLIGYMLKVIFFGRVFFIYIKVMFFKGWNIYIVCKKEVKLV